MGQALNKVNAAILSILLLQMGCSSETVPSVDAIQAAYDRSDLATARELARRALNANPADPRVILLNSQIAIESDSPDYAINALRPLMDDPDYGTQARAWLGRALVMRNQPAEALQVLGNRPSTDGLSAAVSVVAFRNLGDLDRAREAFASGKAAFPKAPDILLIEAEEALRIGDIGHARNVVGVLLHEAPRKVDSQMLATRLDLVDGQPAKAERRLDWILKVRPDHPAALLTKGGILIDRGDMAGGEVYLKKAAKMPGNASLVAQYLRARVAYDKGRIAEARQLGDEIDNPSIFPPAARLVGILAAQGGQNDRAIRLLQPYLASNPDDAQAREALARALAQTGDMMAAWHYLEPAARSPQASASILTLAAQMTTQIGLPNAAQWQSRLERAQKSEGRLALFVQGQKAIQSGNWRRADQIYADLLRTAPPTGDRILLNNAAYIRQQLGDLDEAERLIRRALALGAPDGIVLDTAAWILFQKYGPTREARDFSARAEKLLPSDANVKAHAALIRAPASGAPAA